MPGAHHPSLPTKHSNKAHRRHSLGGGGWAQQVMVDFTFTHQNLSSWGYCNTYLDSYGLMPISVQENTISWYCQKIVLCGSLTSCLGLWPYKRWPSPGSMRHVHTTNNFLKALRAIREGRTPIGSWFCDHLFSLKSVKSVKLKSKWGNFFCKNSKCTVISFPALTGLF